MNYRIKSFLKLRKIVGFLGFLFPLSLVAGGAILKIPQLGSISDYYHTPLKPIFVAIMTSICSFLYFYEGYDKEDNLITKLAAISGLFLLVFPTSIKNDFYCSIYQNQTIHLLSAFVFFLLLSYMSLFQFTKSGISDMTKNKEKRNIFYVSSGIVMLVCLFLIIFDFGLKHKGGPGFGERFVFFAEWIALSAFGVSWIVKGEAILKDEEK